VQLVSVGPTTTTIVLTVSRAEALQPNHKGPPTGERVTAARLVLPTPAFMELYKRMHRLVTQLQQREPAVGKGGARTLQ